MSKETISVAFVDDHDAIRTAIKTFISLSGRISVDIEARNGKEFLQKLSQAKTLPDVCLLDINMPVMNGYETQIELIKRYPDIRTLVFTAHGTELAICRMISYGAKGYLLKSCTAPELEAAIESIYSKGIYHSEVAGRSLFHSIKSRERKMPNFTEQEMDVLRLCRTELTYTEIAKTLHTTPRSVVGHRDSLCRKLNVSTRTALVLYAVELGLIPLMVDSNKNEHTPYSSI